MKFIAKIVGGTILVVFTLFVGCGMLMSAGQNELKQGAGQGGSFLTSLSTGAPDGLTKVQKTAWSSATQYLNTMSFSREGLIQQLSSSAGNSYKVADATVAVDSLVTDWNENAARSARNYLNMSGFSCKGLIQQLSSSAGDKYTVSQAKYGAQKAGAC